MDGGKGHEQGAISRATFPRPFVSAPYRYEDGVFLSLFLSLSPCLVLACLYIYVFLFDIVPPRSAHLFLAPLHTLSFFAFFRAGGLPINIEKRLLKQSFLTLFSSSAEGTCPSLLLSSRARRRIGIRAEQEGTQREREIKCSDAPGIRFHDLFEGSLRILAPPPAGRSGLSVMGFRS